MTEALPLRQLGTSVHTIPRKPVPSKTASVSSDASFVPHYEAVAQQEEPSPQHTKSKSRVKWPQYVWLSECAFLLFALANLAAIAILLILRKDSPCQSGHRFLISMLSSRYSVLFSGWAYSFVLRNASVSKWLWFDQPNMLSDFDRFGLASRGPWGALKLVSRRPLNLVSTLGAVITVIAIAVDLFTQQVLRFYSCARPDDAQTASIPRSNNYTIGEPAASSSGAMIDAKLTGALYQGMLNPFTNSTVAVSTYCPSGNCTFTHTDDVAYSSLAMCTSVKDITKSVIGSGHLGPMMGETGA